MFAALAGFSLGILLLQQQASLPLSHALAGWTCALTLPVLLYLLGQAAPESPRQVFTRGIFAGGLALCLGFAYAHLRAAERLADALPSAWEQRDIRLEGHIAALPQTLSSGIRPVQRFDFVVERILTPTAIVPSRIRLSWYGEPPHSDQFPTDTPDETGADEPADTFSRQPALQAGQRWQLTARLKRPHGNANPDGFDYEGWLFQHGIRATGYVRAGPLPPQMLAIPARSPLLWLEAARGQLRSLLQFNLPAEEHPLAGILAGLAIGDQGAIPDAQWATFNRTGTTHLMVVSGSHITLLAGLLAALARHLWSRWPRAVLWCPAPQAAAIVGGLSALFYTGLTGFGIPAQRTLLMLATVCLALISRRALATPRILATAWMLVLVLDPWAVLAPGFWLSFATVAALLLVGTPGQPGLRERLRLFWHSQRAATLATLPLLLLFFQQLPVISPLANLLAIPVISLLVTPLSLLGLAGLLLPAPLASWGTGLLQLAHALTGALLVVLEWLATLPAWQVPAAPLWALLLAALGAGCWLLPPGLPARRMLGTLSMLPALCWPVSQPPQGEWWAEMLDVGQGQAILIRTREHVLLYDSGPQYGPPSPGGINPPPDAAQRVILPYLRAQGIPALDLLLISHRDRDHAGGSASLKAALPIGETRSSQPAADETPCRRGQSWNWDEVSFAVLHPEPDASATARPHNNAQSCVLLIRNMRGQSLLLTGDLPAREEGLLVQREGERLRADWLIAPHHGSASSSSEAFVATVAPREVLVSAGYRNRFGHPREPVLARYAAAGSRVWRTDRDGAIRIRPLPADGESTGGWRQSSRRYWRD